jgi:Uma2 family endonuclease
MDMRSLLEEFDLQPSRPEQMSFDQLMTSEQATSEQAAAASEEASPSHRAPAAPVTGRHQDVRLYLAVLLKTFVEMLDAGLVRDAPFDVRLNDDQTFQPDIVFMAHSSFDRVQETYIEGPPDIIIEILIPESTALDRGVKFAAYESSGVREYWLIDPTRELADLYHLGPDGYYDEFRPDIAGRLRSRVLKGFTLDLDLLWRRVLPTTSEIVEMAQEMVNQRQAVPRT